MTANARDAVSAVVKLQLVEGAIAWVEIRDPVHQNRLSEGVALGLLARFLEIAERPEVKVVVLTGREDVFLMEDTAQAHPDGSAGEIGCAERTALYEALLGCEVPVIAAMQGRAAGAGLYLGLYADMHVLAEAGVYSSSPMSHGLTPGPAASFILKAQLGGPLAIEMLYLGRSYTGRELRDRGVSLIVRPAAEVRSEALAIARDVASKPRTALVLLKRELAGRKLAALRREVETEVAIASPTARSPQEVAPSAQATSKVAPETVVTTPVLSAEVNPSEPCTRRPIRLRPKLAVLQPFVYAPIARQRVALPPKRGAPRT